MSTTRGPAWTGEARPGQERPGPEGQAMAGHGKGTTDLVARAKEWASVLADSPEKWQRDRAELVLDLAAALEAATKREQRLANAVVWALGYTDFPPRMPEQGQYWWRRGLRERSGLTPDECAAIAERGRG